MRLLRAILTGALLWVLIFFEVSILMFGLKLTGGVYYIVHYILLGLLIILCSLIYFWRRRVKSGLRIGILLGIIYVIVGSVLDLIITVPLFIESISDFYNIFLVFGLIETIAVTAIVGVLKR